MTISLDWNIKVSSNSFHEDIQVDGKIITFVV